MLLLVTGEILLVLFSGWFTWFRYLLSRGLSFCLSLYFSLFLTILHSTHDLSLHNQYWFGTRILDYFHYVLSMGTIAAFAVGLELGGK